MILVKIGIVLIALLTFVQCRSRVKRMQPMPGYGEMVKKMQSMSMMMPDRKVGEMVSKMNGTGGNPEEMGTYYEGDMLIPMDRDDVKMGKKFQFRWSNGIVPYRFNGDFSPESRETILAAMAQYPLHTCIRFVLHNGEKDYISIENKPTGCWSALGRIGNKQVLNLQSPGCTYSIGTSIHEMMHALGIFHEQSRQDRDKYVRIRWENIIRGKEPNFEEHSKYYGFGVPYDYGSLMHYGLKAFSRNNDRTIEPITREGYQSIENIGQRTAFSKSDIQKINTLYDCDVDATSKTEIHTELRPPNPPPEQPRPNYGRPDFKIPVDPDRTNYLLPNPNRFRPEPERPIRPDPDRINYLLPNPNRPKPETKWPIYTRPDLDRTNYLPNLNRPKLEKENNSGISISNIFRKLVQNLDEEKKQQ